MRYFLLIITVLSISAINLKADDFYWVGGSGDWAEYFYHWAYESGGKPPEKFGKVPGPEDNVIFDENSFGIDDTLRITFSSDIVCRDMDFSKCNNHVVFGDGAKKDIRIYGSMALSSDMEMKFHPESKIYFEATDEGHTITSAGNILNSIIFRGIGGSWILQDSLNVTNNPGSLFLHNGTFNTNNQKVSCITFSAGTHNNKKLVLGSSVIDIYNYWACGGDNTVIEPGTSIIRIHKDDEALAGKDQDYYDVEFVSKKGKAKCSGRSFNKVTFNCDGELQGNSTYNWLNLAPGHKYTFAVNQTFKIVNSLNAIGDCKAYIYISSDTPDINSTINSDDAKINSEYVIIKDITATGNSDFIALNSVDLGNNVGWTIESANPRNLFWIGGSSVYWDDANNWSITSGGSGPECIPTPYDNVYFDDKSFLFNDTVIIRNTISFCRDMDWSDVIGKPVFKTENRAPINIFGSLTLSPYMQISFSSDSRFLFEATDEGHTITSAGNILNFIVFNGIGGSWILQDSLNVTNNPGSLFLHNGTFNTNNQKVSCITFSAGTHNNKKLVLGSSVIDIYNYWACGGDNTVIEPGTSIIRIHKDDEALAGKDQDYYDVEFVSKKGKAKCSGRSFNKVTFNCDGELQGNSTYNWLNLAPGHKYTFAVNQTFKISDQLNIYGNNCYPIVIQSSEAGEQATIYKESGEVSGDFLELRDINAVGGADFYAGNNSTDVSGNSGWRFTNSPKYVYGFGEDRVFCIGDTLFTQYFHNPERYEWDDGSTKPFRIIDGPGEYFVVGWYGDKCFWSDTINVNIINLYADNVENMTIIEDAYHADSTVILTPSKPWQFGGMWYQTYVSIAEGFTTEFSFRFTDGVNDFEFEESPGADGFAFLIQNYSNSKLGNKGGGMGFEGMTNSFAIEFDTYYNNDPGRINDPSENHIGVFCNGIDSNNINHLSKACLATLDLKDKMPILCDGTIYYCRIDFDQKTKELVLYLNDSPEYTDPILVLNNIDFAEMLELKQDEFAWVGFSSATGKVYQYHEIMSWNMCPASTKSVLTDVEDNSIPYSENQNKLKLYPNPVNETLYIESYGPIGKIQIVDLMGRLLFEQDIQSNRVQIDIDFLTSGAYYIRSETQLQLLIKE